MLRKVVVGKDSQVGSTLGTVAPSVHRNVYSLPARIEHAVIDVAVSHAVT